MVTLRLHKSKLGIVIPIPVLIIPDVTPEMSESEIEDLKTQIAEMPVEETVLFVPAIEEPVTELLDEPVKKKRRKRTPKQ